MAKVSGSIPGHSRVPTIVYVLPELDTPYANKRDDLLLYIKSSIKGDATSKNKSKFEIDASNILVKEYSY